MKTYSYILLAITPLLILASCAQPQEAPVETVQVVKTVNVRAQNLAPSQFESKYTVIGHVVSENDVMLSSEANGRILKYFVNRGETVAKGQEIAKIDDTLLKMERTRTQAIVNQSKENYERLKRLWEEEKIGTEIDFLNAKYAFEQNQALLANIDEQINRTVLKAPFEGLIDEKMSEEGESVALGTPMVRLIQTSKVKVRVGIPSRYASVVNVGDPVMVDFRVEGEAPLKSKITFVSSSIDPKSRTFTVEADVSQRANSVKIDAEASVTVFTDSFDNVLILPQQYIFRNENGYQVFVVETDEEGHTIARAKSVTLGALSGNERIIESGITTSDRVITEGFALVEDHMRINVIDESNYSSLD